MNISTVFVAVSVFRFFVWERLLSATTTLSCVLHIINKFGCPIQNMQELR